MFNWITEWACAVCIHYYACSMLSYDKNVVQVIFYHEVSKLPHFIANWCSLLICMNFSKQTTRLLHRLAYMHISHDVKYSSKGNDWRISETIKEWETIILLMIKESVCRAFLLNVVWHLFLQNISDCGPSSAVLDETDCTKLQQHVKYCLAHASNM